MCSIVIKIKNNLVLIIFLLVMGVIGFGSLGGGTYNNYNISYSFIYLFIFMVFFYHKEVIKYINPRLLLPILIMFISFFISCLFPNFSNYKDIWLRYYAIFSCVLFGYFSYILIREQKISFILLNRILAIIGLIHIGVLLYLWFSIPNPQTYNWVNGLIFFPNIRHLVDFLTICFLCALILFFNTDKKPLQKILWYLIATIILSCIFWSGSRAAYIGLIPSMIILIWLSRKQVTNIFSLGSSIFLATYLSSFFDTSNHSLGFVRAVNRSTDGTIEQVSTGRFDLYRIVFEWFSCHPIWGNGAEAMMEMEIYQNGLIIFQAHNSILQILVEFGLVGLICVLYVLYALIREFKGKQLNRNQIFGIVIVINIMTAALFNGGAYYVVTISLISLFIATIYAEENMKSKEI